MKSHSAASMTCHRATTGAYFSSLRVPAAICRAARLALVLLAVVAVFSSAALPGWGHDQSRLAFLRQLRLARARASAQAVDPEEAAGNAGLCRLTIDLVDDADRAVPGIVRVTDVESGKAVRLKGEFHRAANWYALAATSTIEVPCKKLKIEALRGLATELATREVDLAGVEAVGVELQLRQFYDATARGLRSGNTHLHLMNLTHREADRYLRLVPRADNLDLVFLSHLRRIPDERTYISNAIVENSFAGGDLARLSESGTLFVNGEEHRHNFGRGGEGYGHVMFLDLEKLIRPVSIGPGIMREGTDGLTLRRGIRQAREDGATVIWCHNTFGFEDIPNWAEGLLDAQNIFDGGNHGSYEDTYYRYLNLGLKVPFSTGTDWFIYDFSRVYVPVFGELTKEAWLSGLREGRSYITNGPFLELETERGEPGDTLRLDGPNRVTVRARGMGRRDFHSLELVYNGKVVHRVRAEKERGYHFARMRHGLEVTESGWFAVRIPAEAGTSELDRPLFAHSSPIYLDVAGEPIFDKPTARGLIEEIREGMGVIEEKGSFTGKADRDAVLQVYRDAITKLEAALQRAE